jgi:hypothetical protein
MSCRPFGSTLATREIGLGGPSSFICRPRVFEGIPLLYGSGRNTHCWRSVRKKRKPMSTMPPEIPTSVIAKDAALFFQDADHAAREEGDYVVYQLGTKAFRLNKAEARERFAGKRVINGYRSAELNVLPLKYHEAYRIYKQMKANHWETDVIDMARDVQHWVNPFAWLDEVIFLRKEKNFFETRVTEYQTSGSVKNTSEEDLI